MVRRSQGLHAIHATPAAKAARRLLSGVRGRRPVRWRVEVLDLDGVPVAQMNARLGSVSWRLDGHGQGEFTLSRDEMNRLGQVLQPSHFLAVRFDRLPTWVGVIAPPADDTARETTIRAFTPEWLLQYDLSDPDFSREGVWANRAQAIARDLVEGSDILGPWLVRSVSAYIGGGVDVSVAFSYTTLAKALDRLRELDPQFHYRFDCGYEGGRLQIKPRYWRGHWRDLSQTVCLRQGVNLSEAAVVTQGPIVNEVIVAPSGAKWAEKPHVFQGARNYDSAARFGRRREFVTVTEPKTEDIDTLYDYAAQYVTNHGRERLRLQATLIDQGPAAYGEYWLGDRVTVEAPRMGRNGYALVATVIALEFSSDGRLSAVFEDDAAIRPESGV